VDLRLLTTFSTVAELGSVSAAAEALHVTQPALSRQLQQLERQVGVALFHRHHRRLSLTAAGHTFLTAARDVLTSAEAARSLAEALAAGRLERVRAAAPTTTLTDVVAPFLATLGPQDPLITVQEAHSAQAVDGLHDHLDLAVLTIPPPRHLASATVADLPVWAYVRAGHPYAGRDAVPVAELADQRLLVLDPGSRPRALLDEALLRGAIAPRDVVECSNPQVAQALAAAGRGVAVVSDDPRFDLERTLVLDPAGAPLTLRLVAAWDPQHHAAAELAAIAGRLAAFCAERYPGRGRARL
jgi:DNA-binding transcriptional LysR family regulator